MDVHDVRLLVADSERSKAFYRDVMGMEVFVDVPGTYAELQAGGVAVGVYVKDLMAERIGADRVAPAGGALLCIRVDDADSAFQELVTKGATPVGEPHDETTWGLRVAHVADPDGHVIELDQVL